MKPGTFLLYLQIQNSMVQELPGAPAIDAGFSDTQLRRTYLHAMPPAWQSKFEDAHKTVPDTSLNAMHAYFDKQHVKDPYKGQTENNKDKVQSQFGQNANRNSRDSRIRDAPLLCLTRFCLLDGPGLA